MSTTTIHYTIEEHREHLLNIGQDPDAMTPKAFWDSFVVAGDEIARRASEWESSSFDDLSPEENAEIVTARMKGFATFYPCYPTASDQSARTLAGAREFMKGRNR